MLLLKVTGHIPGIRILAQFTVNARCTVYSNMRFVLSPGCGIENSHVALKTKYSSVYIACNI
jgi:hypothetical protein